MIILMILLPILSRSLCLTYFFSFNVFDFSLSCVHFFCISFMSDGMDKQISDPIIITLTGLCLAVFVMVFGT